MRNSEFILTTLDNRLEQRLQSHVSMGRPDWISKS